MDREHIIEEVAAAAAEALLAGERENRDTVEKLEQEIERLTRKKTDVLDAFLSERITAEDMALLNERCNRELEALQKRRDAVAEAAKTPALQEDIRKKTAALVNGGTDSGAFYKYILDCMVVCQGGRVEVQLNGLPQRWIYVLERGHFDPSVPISVSSPFSSG